MKVGVVTVTDQLGTTHKIGVYASAERAVVTFEDWADAYPVDQVRLYRGLHVKADTIAEARMKISHKVEASLGFPPPDRERPSLHGDRRYFSTVIDLSEEQYEALVQFGIDALERTDLIVRRIDDGAVQVMEVTDTGVVDRVIARDGACVERRRSFASGGWVEIESFPMPVVKAA